MNVLLSAFRANIVLRCACACETTRLAKTRTHASRGIIVRECVCLCLLLLTALCFVWSCVCVRACVHRLWHSAQPGSARRPAGGHQRRDNLYVFCVPSSQLCTRTRRAHTIVRFCTHGFAIRQFAFAASSAKYAHMHMHTSHMKGETVIGENDGQFRVIQFAY